MSRIGHLLWVAIGAAAFLFGRAVNSNLATSDTTRMRLATHLRSVPESPVGASTLANEPTLRTGWQAVLHEFDPRRREQAALALVVGRGREECEALIAQLDRAPRSLRRDELQLLIYERWAEFDGEGALASAQSRPGDEREQAITSVVRGWVAADSSTAWSWISDATIASGSWDSIALGYYQVAIESLVERGSGDVAAQLIMRTPENRLPERLVPMLAKSWNQQDLGATTQWVEAFPQGGQSRESGIRAIAHSLTLVGPDVALSWAQSLANEDLGVALGAITVGWTRVGDTADVVAWASDLAPNPVYDDAFAALGTVLVPYDLDRAFDFINSQSDPGKRDRSLVRALQTVPLTEPSKAMVWAQSISDVDSRTRTIGNIFRKWSRRDAAGARAFVENSSEIPSELRQRLLQRP